MHNVAIILLSECLLLVNTNKHKNNKHVEWGLSPPRVVGVRRLRDEVACDQITVDRRDQTATATHGRRPRPTISKEHGEASGLQAWEASAAFCEQLGSPENASCRSSPKTLRNSANCHRTGASWCLRR